MKKRLLSLALMVGLWLGLTVSASAFDTGKIGELNFMTAASGHCGFVDSEGNLWSWGWNAFQQVGNAAEGDVDAPVKVLTNVASVSAAQNFTAAVKKDGTLWLWGDVALLFPDNMYKKIYFQGCPEPMLYPETQMQHVAAVSCGFGHIAVIKEDGTLWLWGSNSSGQIGNGDVGPDYRQPVKILDDVSMVSCGSSHTAAVKKDGSLWVWGYNKYGQIGNGTRGKNQLTPLKVMDNVAFVNCGANDTAAIKTDGTLWMWGDNTSGQLGNDGKGNESFTVYADLGNGSTTYTMQTEPVQIMTQAVSVQCGIDSTAVIKEDGSLWTWGSNSYAELGLGYRSDKPQKTPQKMWDNTVAVRGGAGSFYAVTADGKVWAWGRTANGRLGLGNVTDKSYLITPAQLSGLRAQAQGAASDIAGVTSFVDVSIGEYYAAPVAWAVEQGITSGDGPNTFSPKKQCTNAQFLTFLWRAYGSPEPSIPNPFSDINGNEYYYKAALWFVEKRNQVGIHVQEGVSFDADILCPRSLALYYMWIAAGSPTPTTAANFTDVPDRMFYSQAVAWAVEQGITSGSGGSRFVPHQICTRSEVMTFLYRAFA